MQKIADQTTSDDAVVRDVVVLGNGKTVKVRNNTTVRQLHATPDTGRYPVRFSKKAP